jgi:hypothetical protein
LLFDASFSWLVFGFAPATSANAFCERVMGTIRRECLDWIIPLNESHLRRVFRHRVEPCNRGRPHASFRPGIPDAPELAPPPSGDRIRGGLHHEDRLDAA